MTTFHTGSEITPTRRGLMAVGVLTLALSLVLSIAPALAKNENEGTIKIFDAANSTELTGTDPHVCSFWVGFFTSDTPETGAWQLLSWPPTGDKTVVESGTYDTSPGGQDATGTVAPDAGHYRFEWYKTGESNGKNKTLWVDVECAASTDPTTPPSEDPSTPPSEDPTTPPSEDPTTPPSEDPSTPPASEGEVLAGNPDPTAIPEGEVLSGRSTDTSPALPDTSTGFEASGLLAALGVLLIVGAHAHTRRSRLA